MSLEEVCMKLRKYGFDCDAGDIKSQCESDEELAGVHRNLQKMLKEIDAEAARALNP
jgi:hypothetical protein